jgi:hypothetical protein
MTSPISRDCGIESLLSEEALPRCACAELGAAVVEKVIEDGRNCQESGPGDVKEG